MRRCLQLADLGRGKVAPNPLVGCVIVHEGLIIGEGYHRKFGCSHAEVEAVNSVKNPELLRESTVYVSLEPCSHYGKTPPCADLLVNHQVKKVVIGCVDSNEKVAGKGIAILKAAGIEVETGILEEACRKQNERFFTFHEKKRPFIILKWAETKDGFIAGGKKQISGKLAQTILHKWRTEEQAFLIGTNTLLEDNPRLNARLWKGNNPLRVAIDFELKSLAFNEKHGLCFYDGTQKTMILNGRRDDKTDAVDFVKLNDKSPQAICAALAEENIQSVILEGGRALLQSFLDENLWDELRVFQSKEMLFGNGLSAPLFEAEKISVQDLETDTLSIYRPV